MSNRRSSDGRGLRVRSIGFNHPREIQRDPVPAIHASPRSSARVTAYDRPRIPNPEH